MLLKKIWSHVNYAFIFAVCNPMKKRLFFIFVLLAGIVAFFYFYKGGELFKKMVGGKSLREGIIEYDISYPTLTPGSMMVAGLPNKAYLRFKNNNTVNDLSGMMGLINITFISQAQKKKVTQTLNLINKKYVSEIAPEELSQLNNSYIEGILPGKNKMEIAGYSCSEAIVKLKNGQTIHVFYTKDIGIENPNWSNPYHKVEGVLMDFQMERYGLSMHLKAKQVLEQSVEDNIFSVDGKHKSIPFAEMEKILQELNPVQ